MNDQQTTQSTLQAEQRTLAVLVLILIGAFVLRAAVAVILDRYVQSSGRSFLVEGDANGYWELAQKLANGEDYAIHQPPRYVLRVPGFPLFLAASIKVFGDSVLAARFLLALVGTCCCLLTYLLARQLGNKLIGLVAAGFLAVHPLQVASSVLILSETWFTFWMLLSLMSLTAFLNRFRDQPGKFARQSSVLDFATSTRLRLRRHSLMTGILIGATSLIRPGFLPWTGFCVIAILACRQRPWKARMVQTCFLVIGCLLIMMPWALRNREVTGHVVLTSLWSGPSLYDGLNPEATGASDMTFFDEEQVMSNMSEYDMNRHYTQRAVRFAIDHPSRAVSLAFHKAGLYLAPIPNLAKQGGWVVGGVCAVFWAALFLGFSPGIRCVFSSESLGLSENRSLVLLVTLGPLLLFLLVHLVFVGSVRYRLPVEFPMSILAAAGWAALLFPETAKSR